MRVRESIFLGGCLGAAVIAACSPYDPDLGAAPYLCAAQEPRCPDDYMCMEQSSRSVCVAIGGAPPAERPDSPTGLQCAMDGLLEPNNKATEAYQTDVGLGAPMRVFGPLSLCPEGDEDYFQINVTVVNKGIEAITRWDSGMPVSCALLLSTGDPKNPLKKCTTMGLNAQRACATNLPAGVYYAHVFIPGFLKNNYRIELKLVDACL